MAALSYRDQLLFGVTLDYDSAPEVELIRRAITDGLADLVKAARKATRTAAPAKAVPPGHRQHHAGSARSQAYGRSASPRWNHQAGTATRWLGLTVAGNRKEHDRCAGSLQRIRSDARATLRQPL